MTVGNARPVRQLRRFSAADAGSGQPDQTPDHTGDVISSDEELGTGRKRPRDEQPRLARIVSHDAQALPNASTSCTPHGPSTHNRRGLFNSPVDHVALGLTDYETIITQPRDLGTIKAKLHAVSYDNREEVADDIRLVFVNAMTYSPPNNPVHIAAKHLLQNFEEAYQVMKATSNPSTLADTKSANSKSWSCIPTEPAPRHDATRSISMVDVAQAAACEPLPTPPSAVQLTPLTVATVTSSSEATNVERNASAAVDRLFESGVDASANPPLGDSCSGPIVPPNPAVPVETKCGLRGSHSSSQHLFAAPPQAEKALKRALNVAAKHAKHSCRSCLGRTCSICEQGCLSHEPALLICTGSNCMGAKIRKGVVYYIAKDGSRQFCQRCYTNLQAVLPHTADQIESFGSSVRYKRDLLKRKNEEDVAEAWLTCKSCHNGVHKVCSMYNEFVHSDEDYECPSCTIESEKHASSLKKPSKKRKSNAEANDVGSDYYTCVSGSDTPVKLSDVAVSLSILSAESLPETPVSAFIQQRVRDCIAASNVPNAEDCDCSCHFRLLKLQSSEVVQSISVNQPHTRRILESTPTKERLIAWYHGAINRCVESGVVTDVQSLFESSFPLATGVRTSDAGIALSPENMTVIDEGVLDGRMACPPLMDGDFWIEEAVRLHATSIVRHLKSKPSPAESDTATSACPAVVTILLRDRIMAQSAAAPFRRPVNAASLQLKDYHKRLRFANFFKELDSLTKTWPTNQEQHDGEAELNWTYHAKTSTSLDTLLDEPADAELTVPERVCGADETVPKPTSPAIISISPKPKGELRIQLPEDIMLGQESSLPSDHCSPSTVTALLPSSGRKPTSQSPASLNKTANAMFAFLNSKLELLTGGEDAILQKMVGNDIWIMDKKCPSTPKPVAGKKKAAWKRRKGAGDSSNGDEPPAKRRRQCWLGEEVGLSVRKMTDFFSCSLVPKANMSPEEASKEGSSGIHCTIY
ncbi:histone acetyltransferase [Fragilaria crotonensis]|nr:histone acetyltransferase [Fragilaria crotonensis]